MNPIVDKMCVCVLECLSMSPKEGGIKPVEEQREASKLALSKSGFPSVVKELTQNFPGASVLDVTWDERGNCSVEEGVKREPNSAGILIKFGRRQYPEIKHGEFIGTVTIFEVVTVDAHPDGRVEVRGKKPIRKDWADENTQRMALMHALEYPFGVRLLRPATDSEKRDLMVYDARAGETIQETAEAMARRAKNSDKTVVANFNDVGLLVWPGRDAKSIADYFHEEISRNSEEYRKSPQGQRFQRESEARNRKAAIEASKPLAEFIIKDQEGWQKTVEANKDSGYGACVVRYAARWAHMMETQIADGFKLEDIATKMSHKADTEGISGFQYGCAVSILASVWEYGDQLRRWHNLDTQIGNEGEKANETGGVLNPALLTIGR